jgi:NitT/TauT family transport system substrate-binding protein
VKKIAILVYCILFTIAGGCAKQSANQKLTSVTIAFQAWVGYGPFYLAQEKGFYEKEGLDIIFVNEQLDSARRQAFKERMLDCEAATLDLLISKVALDTPVVAVMQIDASSGADAIVVLGDIKTLNDLIGKRVALARDDVGETFISTLFYKNNLPFNGLHIIPRMPEEVAQAFVNGQADACVTWEPQVTEALKVPGAHVLASTREYPGIIIDTLNVRRDLVENNPELVKKLMRGWFKGVKYYKEHPIEASGIIAKHYNITPEQYRKQVEGLKWIEYQDQIDSSGYQRWLDIFNTIVEVKIINNRISQKPDIAKALNHTLIGKLYENSK